MKYKPSLNPIALIKINTYSQITPHQFPLGYPRNHKRWALLPGEAFCPNTLEQRTGKYTFSHVAPHTLLRPTGYTFNQSHLSLALLYEIKHGCIFIPWLLSSQVKLCGQHSTCLPITFTQDNLMETNI